MPCNYSEKPSNSFDRACSNPVRIIFGAVWKRFRRSAKRRRICWLRFSSYLEALDSQRLEQCHPINTIFDVVMGRTALLVNHLAHVTFSPLHAFIGEQARFFRPTARVPTKVGLSRPSIRCRIKPTLHLEILWTKSLYCASFLATMANRRPLAS